MPALSWFRYLRKWLLSVSVIGVLAAGLLTGVVGTSAASGSLPCDIYGSAGTPCVAAHSTTRALFSAYNGPLYQVTRASDGATADIGLLAQGGYANAAQQDTFCDEQHVSSSRGSTTRPRGTTTCCPVQLARRAWAPTAGRTRARSR